MVNIEMVPIAEIDYLVPDSSFHMPLLLEQQDPIYEIFFYYMLLLTIHKKYFSFKKRSGLN